MHDEAAAHIRAKIIEVYKKLDCLSQLSYVSLVEVRWAGKAAAQLVTLAKDLEVNILLLDKANRLRYLPHPEKNRDAD